MSAGDNRLPVLATEINAEHEAALAAISRGMAHALKAGDLLLEAKASVPHGQWAAWLADNTGLSERTAQRYMQIARERPQLEAKTATVADLTIRAACELIAKPPQPLSALAKASALMPDEGQSLVGFVRTVAGVDIIIITPSAYPDYFYVTHCWLSAKTDKHGVPDDGTWTGMRKPARWQSLPEVVLIVQTRFSMPLHEAVRRVPRSRSIGVSGTRSAWRRAQLTPRAPCRIRPTARASRRVIPYWILDIERNGGT